MTNDEEILVKILKLSHDQVMAGKSYSQEEAEHYLDQRLQNWRSGQHLLIGSSTNWIIPPWHTDQTPFRMVRKKSELTKHQPTFFNLEWAIAHTWRCSQRRGGRRDGCYYHLQQHIPKSLVLHNLVSSFMFHVSRINCQFSIWKELPREGANSLQCSMFNVQCSTF